MGADEALRTAHAKAIYAGTRPGTRLIADGYERYDGLTIEDRLVHFDGWVRARRGFVKLIVTEALSAITSLVRRQRPHRHDGARVRQAAETLLHEHMSVVVPGSLLGKASQYLRGPMAAVPLLHRGRSWPISNNPYGNAIRPFVLGHKRCAVRDLLVVQEVAAGDVRSMTRPRFFQGPCQRVAWIGLGL